MKIEALILSVFLSLFFSSGACRGSVKIILDTDMAGDCDDAGALAVLHGLADLGEAEILAIVTNLKDPGNASAAAVGAINTYYGRPDIPIGTDKDVAQVPRTRESPYARELRDHFPQDALPDDAMPDALEIYRAKLAGQPDGEVTICSVGALSNLEDLLNSEPDQHSPLTGRELVGRKVKQLIIMGGGFPRAAKQEFNIRVDPAAAVTVANLWPGPVLWHGFEVGFSIYTGAELSNTPDANPVKRAYALRPFRGATALDFGKPSFDQAAVLMAVRGPEMKYWSLSGPGRVVIDSLGRTEWMPTENGTHQFVTIQCHPRILEDLISDLMAAPPGYLLNRD